MAVQSQPSRPVTTAIPAAMPLLRQQVIEQRIEDGRIVLRRTTVEEIEIRHT